MQLIDHGLKAVDKAVVKPNTYFRMDSSPTATIEIHREALHNANLYIYDMSLSPDELNTLGSFFSGKRVIKAFLFGSHSRNEANVESDIDILVELDYSQHIGLSFIRMKSDTETALNKIDLVSEHPFPGISLLSLKKKKD